MTRMGKEFTLVLLGAGILTAGSFLWPADDLEQRADKAAQEQVAGPDPSGHTHYRHGGLIFLHTGGWGGASSSPARAASVSRSGFGGMGRSFSVGG